MTELWILTPSGAVLVMADRLMALMENAELRCKFSRNASIGMEEFDETEVLRKWEMLLAEVTSR